MAGASSRSKPTPPLSGAASLRYQMQSDPGRQPSLPEPLSLTDTYYASEIEGH